MLLTADNDVLESSRDGATSLLVEYRLITCMEPQHSILIPRHYLGCLLAIVPVACLQLISTHPQLAPLANGYDFSVMVHNLGMGMRHQRAHCTKSRMYGVVREGIEACRRGLSQAIAGSELCHAKFRDELFHEVARHRRAGNDACPQSQVGGVQ